MNIKQKLLSTNRFNDNNYLDLYIELLNQNRDLTFKKCVTQKHHIIPRYVFKALNIPLDNSKDNLIILLFKDHILAHYYLALCSNNSSDRYCNELAILRMIGDSELPLEDKTWIQNLDKYQELYEDAQLNNRNIHLGKPAWNKGLTYNRIPTSESTKEIISEKAKGRYKGHIWIHKDLINKHIDPIDLEIYLKEGFEIGRYQPEAYKKISQTQKENPNCSMKGRHQSDFQRKTVSKKLTGVPKSDKAKLNMSNAKKGKILISNKELNHSLYIDKAELDSYKIKGYFKGKLSQNK